MSKLPPLAPLSGIPAPEPNMNWRSLNSFREQDRGSAFYLTCLKYAQHLWLQRLPARAILCLDRAWGADLTGTESVLQEWPLPYAPLVELLQNAPAGAFLGNPRVHFQHYADRLGEPRKQQRKWRAWACWALARAALPQLASDPKHAVEEPSQGKIAPALATHGIPGEVALWQAAFPPKKPTPST